MGITFFLKTPMDNLTKFKRILQWFICQEHDLNNDSHLKTSMLWLSQNFLLQNSIILIFHVKFYKIICKRSRDTTITKVLQKKVEQQHPLQSYKHLKLSLLFLRIHILCINFCAISINRSRNITIPKILEKLCLQHPLSSYTFKNYINVMS